MDWTWYLFRFDGRINRAKLWLAGVVLLGLVMSVGLVIIAIHSLFGGPPSFHFGARDLFKLVDPDAARLEKEELRRHREDQPDDGAPDDDDKPALTLGRPEAHYACRVCSVSACCAGRNHPKQKLTRSRALRSLR